MALTVGTKVNTADIINQFATLTVNKIRAHQIYGQTHPLVHSGYVPTYNSVLVPPSILGSLNSILVANVGSAGNAVQAKKNNDGVNTESYDKNQVTGSIYNALMYVTRNLLRLGTWSYHEHRSCTGYSFDRDCERNACGTALYNESFAAKYLGCGNMNNANFRSGVTVADGGVRINLPVSVSSLNAFMDNLFNEWEASTRPFYHTDYVFCHNSCYQVCHSSCHGSCDSWCEWDWMDPKNGGFDENGKCYTNDGQNHIPKNPNASNCYNCHKCNTEQTEAAKAAYCNG